jgi:hypothetical protein
MCSFVASFDQLISPIIILAECERIGDAVRCPPRELVTMMVLSHVVLVFQRQTPTVIGFSPTTGLAVFE